MAVFKEMDPQLVWKILEGQADVVSPAVKNEEFRFKNTPCPSCRSVGCQPFINARRPFTPGSILPNKLLQCLSCKTEFDPDTGLITKASFGSD